MKYNGNDVFHPFNAGLYGIDDCDRALQYDESKESILAAFQGEYAEAIGKALEAAGLRVIGYEYYSPKYYNYATDSIDIEVDVADMRKLLAYIDTHKDAIQARLDANEAYDGYMPLTHSSFDELKSDIKLHNVDITVVTHILSGIDFASFDLNEYLEWEYPCETCDRIHGEIENENDEDAALIRACPDYQREQTRV